jgi:hypothetical protein
MAKLKTSELSFLRRVSVEAHLTYDVSGMTTAEWKNAMRALGKIIAFGATPCAAHGHRLRTRAGHCAQCNPANISYLKRMDTPGDVYVAWSKSSSFCKIGSALNAYEREVTLRKSRYGGASDWEIALIYTTTHSGELETIAQRCPSSNGLRQMG